MNIARRNKPLRALFRLQSALTVLVALCLYTLLTHFFLTPRITVIRDDGTCSFLATDLQDPLRPSLANAIKAANHSIVLIIYGLSDRTILSALRTAAQRGVAVTVIHDPNETPHASMLLGKAVSCFPRRERGLMHNKLLVIDHTDVWMGSANMSSRSLTEQGNLVAAIRSKPIASAIEKLASTMIARSSYEHEPLHVAFNDSTFSLYFHPFHGRHSLDFLVRRINAASHRIFVAMFTFTHPDLIDALCRAHRRGVDVRVLFDHESSKQTSRKAYLRFKREGVPCGYRTKSGLLHYKVALIDNMLVAGSCNWTSAAFTINYETMLFIDSLNHSQQQWLQVWWDTIETKQSTLNCRASHDDPAREHTVGTSCPAR
jgi:phosphatidylserine/phosphatidylglycerophosphate/cardiolipin synthase-like enzyme